MKITTVGVDLAKNVFSVHGVDEHGKTVLRKTVRRSKPLELFAQMPVCVVGMEARGGAQHWARELRKLGHEPRIMCGVSEPAADPDGTAARPILIQSMVSSSDLPGYQAFRAPV